MCTSLCWVRKFEVTPQSHYDIHLTSISELGTSIYSIHSILVSQGWRRLDLWTESQLNLLSSLAVQLPSRATFVHTSGCQKSHLTILQSSQCACVFQLTYLTGVFHFIQSSINSLTSGFFGMFDNLRTPINLYSYK